MYTDKSHTKKTNRQSSQSNATQKMSRVLQDNRPSSVAKLTSSTAGNVIQRVQKGNGDLTPEQEALLDSQKDRDLWLAARDAGVLPEAGGVSMKTIKGWVFGNETCPKADALKIIAQLQSKQPSSIDIKRAAGVAAKSWMETGHPPHDIDLHVKALSGIPEPETQALAIGMRLESARQRETPLSKAEDLGPLAAGKMNTTYKVGMEDGTIKVFKPDHRPKGQPDGFTPAIIDSGINPLFPRASARSTAVSRLDQHLQLGAIPATTTARVSHMPGMIGSLMDLAKGVSLDSMPAHERTERFKDPKVKKGLMDLQLLDFVTGEMDRHHGNIFIGPKREVQGIDNDMSFGPTAKPGTSQNKGIPKFIDAGTADKIMRLNPQVLDHLLHDLLTPAEITAAKARLVKIKAVIEEALAQKRTVPGGWKDVDDKDLDENNSYFYRE